MNQLIILRNQEYNNACRWTKELSSVSKTYLKLFDNAIINNYVPDEEGWVLLGCFTDVYAEIKNSKPPIKKEIYYINIKSPLNCFQYKVMNYTDKELGDLQKLQEEEQKKQQQLILNIQAQSKELIEEEEKERQKILNSIK